MPPSSPSASPVTSASPWNSSLQAVLDHPPATLSKRLTLAGIVFCCSFGLWAWFGKIHETSYAVGRLVPQGEVYKVQPTAAGEVINILVKEGQHITQGQVIAELDPRIAQAEVERLQHSLEADQTKLSQTQTLIYQTELQAETQQAIAQAQIQAQTAQLNEAQANIATQQSVLSQLRIDQNAYHLRVQRLRPLVEEGALPEEHLFEVEQEERDRRRTFFESQGALAQSQASSQRFQAELAERQATARHSILASQERLQQLKLDETELLARIQATKSQLKTAQTQLQQSFLRAPVTGTVSTLTMSNVGEVVQPGQTIAEIAPENLPLVLSAVLPSREAGFVTPGMPVQVKFDAFPFQDYGVISGTLQSVSPDTWIDEKLGAVYRVKVALERTSITGNNQTIALQAGQTATAEIVVRERRIIDVLLEPFRKLQKDTLKM